MPKYKITCPHCGKFNIDENYTSAMCEIPHQANCAYIQGNLPTKMIHEVTPVENA